MSWAKEMNEATRAYARRITLDDAMSLSLYFMVGVAHGDRSYIPKFYNLLKNRMNLSDEMVNNLMEDSEDGKKGTEVALLDRLMHGSDSLGVRKTIELALNYSMEIEHLPANSPKG